MSKVECSLPIDSIACEMSNERTQADWKSKCRDLRAKREVSFRIWTTNCLSPMLSWISSGQRDFWSAGVADKPNSPTDGIHWIWVNWTRHGPRSKESFVVLRSQIDMNRTIPVGNVSYFDCSWPYRCWWSTSSLFQFWFLWSFVFKAGLTDNWETVVYRVSDGFTSEKDRSKIRFSLALMSLTELTPKILLALVTTVFSDVYKRASRWLTDRGKRRVNSQQWPIGIFLIFV